MKIQTYLSYFSLIQIAHKHKYYVDKTSCGLIHIQNQLHIPSLAILILILTLLEILWDVQTFRNVNWNILVFIGQFLEVNILISGMKKVIGAGRIKTSIRRWQRRKHSTLWQLMWWPVNLWPSLTFASTWSLTRKWCIGKIRISKIISARCFVMFLSDKFDVISILPLFYKFSFPELKALHLFLESQSHLSNLPWV